MAILIVDDSEDICLLLKSMLEAAGHSDLIRAGSAAEALSILGVGTDPSSQKVDLILMDVDMPEMDGIEACRRIKEVEEFRNIPVIMLTAMDSHKLLNVAFESGAADFISKPFNKMELYARVGSALRLKKVVDRLIERVKEQTCLYRISDLMAKPECSLDEVFQGIAQLIPSGWQYPEITSARITYEERVSETENFVETPWRQTADIEVSGEKAGAVDVCYLHEKLEEDEGPFLKEERDLIDNLSRGISVFCERQKAEEELKNANIRLKELSLIDGLTGVANRRYFDDYLDEEWRRARRDLTPLSIVLVDIDFFKPYNDTYGHIRGDECLKLVAETLKSTLHRPADLLTRFGGEEFVAILPETDHEGAMVIAEKFRLNVESLQMEHANSEASDFVTISLGVATMEPERVLAPQELVKAADRAMYRAKEEGRNRVISGA